MSKSFETSSRNLENVRIADDENASLPRKGNEDVGLGAKLGLRAALDLRKAFFCVGWRVEVSNGLAIFE
jgi:hypothetical protein